ncbi:hypothetical protein [Bacillus gobiensis]|uniref:hypothetical protein n=1 Tax=Bacillus gobiensis TaxID=1441095 RepID=UPI003D1E4577
MIFPYSKIPISPNCGKIFMKTFHKFKGGVFTTKKLIVITLAVLLSINLFLLPASKANASAGLAWGPVYVGNLKFSMTNVHKGYAGPKFPDHSHTNFHVDKKTTKNKYKEVANYHIVKYSKGKSQCVYIWDSETKKVVMDSCGDSWTTMASKAASAMKSFTSTLLSNADWLASLAIWGTITLVIIDLIVPADPIPILPLSTNSGDDQNQRNTEIPDNIPDLPVETIEN